MKTIYKTLALLAILSTTDSYAKAFELMPTEVHNSAAPSDDLATRIGNLAIAGEDAMKSAASCAASAIESATSQVEATASCAMTEAKIEVNSLVSNLEEAGKSTEKQVSNIAAAAHHELTIALDDLAHKAAKGEGKAEEEAAKADEKVRAYEEEGFEDEDEWSDYERSEDEVRFH